VERQKGSYEPIGIVGWAAKPFYDKDKKILHWAKEYGSAPTHQYPQLYVRVGPKRGVGAECHRTMPNLPWCRKISKVLDIVQFNGRL